MGKSGDTCPNVNNRGVPSGYWSKDGTDLDGEGDKCSKYEEVLNFSLVCLTSIIFFMPFQVTSVLGFKFTLVVVLSQQKVEYWKITTGKSE